MSVLSRDSALTNGPLGFESPNKFVGELLRDRLNVLFALAFDHHPGKTLGSAVADEHAATIAKLCFDVSNGALQRWQ